MPRDVQQTQRGSVLQSSQWNRITEYIKRNIVGGRGITIGRQGQQLVISAETGGRAGGAKSSTQAQTLSVDTVENLPAVPTSGIRFVYWTSAGAGTGDNQVWSATEYDSVWTPEQQTTTNNNTPGS